MKQNISADYKKAFKQADIRGVYSKEIDEEVTYLIARAFVDEYKHKDILVARDMRLSSPALHQAFCKGVMDAGANVIDLGLVSTPMLYFASGSLKLPGVMITASHSPKNFNGLKLVLAEAIPLTEKNGLGAIRKRIEKGKFTEPGKVGRTKVKDITKTYQKFILKGVNTRKYKDIEIVADFGNGMAGVSMSLLFEKLPIEFTNLFADLDGNFPNRDSDPTLNKNQKELKKVLKVGKYDFGISFDGDADRIAFLDEKGNFVNSASIGALISEHILKLQPKSRIVYTILTSKILEERIKHSGGVPVRAKVGHAFIKETMRQKDVLFGCEHSGHFYFKDFFFTDSVALTLLYVLDIYLINKKQGLSFSEMMEPYTMYKQTEDVIVAVDNKEEALKLTVEYLQSKNPIQVRKFDGVWVDFGEVWGGVKISVTEPALKIMFESKIKSKAQSFQDDVVKFIKSIAKK